MKVLPFNVQQRRINYQGLDKACQEEIDCIRSPTSTTSSGCCIFFKSKKERMYQHIKCADDKAEIIALLSAISAFARHQRDCYYRAIDFENADFQTMFLSLLCKIDIKNSGIMDENGHNFEQQLQQFDVVFNHAILNKVKNEGIHYFVKQKEEEEQEAIRRSQRFPGMRWHR